MQSRQKEEGQREEEEEGEYEKEQEQVKKEEEGCREGGVAGTVNEVRKCFSLICICAFFLPEQG